MPQTTFVGDTVEAVDKMANNFAEHKDKQVFATHTDWKIQWHPDKTDFIQLHKVTLFWKEVSPEIKQEYPQSDRKEAGAAWYSKKYDNTYSVKMVDGTWINVRTEDLQDIGNGELAVSSSGRKLIFVPNHSPNPKAPKYRVYEG